MDRPNSPAWDLNYPKGVAAENELHQIILDSNGLVEVKREVGKWRQTGNIALEYRYRKQPSGIASTKADWWAHALNNSSGDIDCVLLFRTQALRDIVRPLWPSSVVHGGDGNKSSLILAPLNYLMDGLRQR